jgi:hypothetical protein
VNHRCPEKRPVMVDKSFELKSVVTQIPRDLCHTDPESGLQYCEAPPHFVYGPPAYGKLVSDRSMLERLAVQGSLAPVGQTLVAEVDVGGVLNDITVKEFSDYMKLEVVLTSQLLCCVP